MISFFIRLLSFLLFLSGLVSFVCPEFGLESRAYLDVFTITMVTVFGLDFVISFGVALLCD